jgi:broad specificity phosphatase PhoE
MALYPQTSFSAPPGATRITLVRHGQTEPADLANPFPLKHGHGDPNLTELGEQQAVKVADRLVNEAIDGLYVSSLIRTHQTAERTSGALTGIHERHGGEHIVCFVHGGVIAALCAHTTGAPMTGFVGADNCSIHRLVLTEERWFLRSFNDSTHLDGVMTPQAAIDTPA